MPVNGNKALPDGRVRGRQIYKALLSHFGKKM
jgi:hypothetical protein